MDDLKRAIEKINSITADSSEQLLVNFIQAWEEFYDQSSTIHDDAIYRVLNGVTAAVAPQRDDIENFFLLQNAVVNTNIGNPDYAQKTYEYLLDAFEEQKSPDMDAVGIIYARYGSCLNAQNKHQEALEIFRKTLAILENKKNEISDRKLKIALAYNNSGLSLANLDRNEEALSFFEKAIDIRSSELPAGHPDLVATQNNIAVVISKTQPGAGPVNVVASPPGAMSAGEAANYREYAISQFITSKNYFIAGDLQHSYFHAMAALEGALNMDEGGREMFSVYTPFAESLRTLLNPEDFDSEDIKVANEFLSLGWDLKA